MRKKIYNLIEPFHYSRKVSPYNILMVLIIFAFLIPLTIRQRYDWFRIIEIVAAAAFVTDYILRWITADYKQEFVKAGEEVTKHPFLKYPFTLMALFDLLAAAVSVVWITLPILDDMRIMMMLRIFGAFKLFRYTKSKALLVRVLKRQRKQLLSVCVIALEYIVITAMIAFNAEPETFRTFFDAIYWAAVSLTTVGFGDIYPTSNIGHIITILSSFFGIAIIAMPSGIITAGFMKEIEEQQSDN